MVFSLDMPVCQNIGLISGVEGVKRPRVAEVIYPNIESD